MERKLLWVISCVVIFILWIKIDPQSSQPKETNKQESSVSKPAEKVQDDSVDNDSDTANEDTETPVTEEEKAYFKSHPISVETPNFAEISDIKTRKQTFFDFLTPFVNEKNTLLLQDRERIKQILANDNPPSREDKSWIGALRKIHRLNKVDVYEHKDIEILLKYIDIIPVSLVLAQAANESAWGTSRFATEGNNYFGQWCFRKGCGLVPNSRSEDADHEVRKFNDARESVFAYIDNLNSNPAYKELRAIRAELRHQDEPISGLALVHGLDKYSQRGQAYVDEIENLIDYNELWRFNVHADDQSTNNE
ncbi:flagellar biosynthesis protein FlgJ [Marinomonas piezotolerans]|uniref:Flagellar biosynthesis protein FlgJ n=1 Tax=Marinomonas piezotolerans TaxID=2213058 RepID=A0A370U7F3_9GAMM|nr:glucosaminidase domain-containing protein [Marinomonas piezotolerans]RDL43726.1 flagellar biosynthesis protein FlgJ [Marinomonas piezotolerans]